MNRDKYRRKAPAMQIKDRVLIMCGAQTEEIYFNQFKEKNRGVLRNVTVIVVAFKKSNPLAVVEAAITRKDDYDEVWAVFDKDDFVDFEKAIALAESSGINCAFSNEAIEYWFLLHIENKTGAISRNVLKKELERKLDIEYDKSEESVRRICRKIDSKIVVAEERARIGHERHIIHSGSNPSDWRSCTTVYALTRRLREWGYAKK